MEKIVSLCKRRGFVFQGSEIYGGLAGVFDFGPRGVELLNNLKKIWWESNVYQKENYYGLDAGMFKHPKTWDASGHTTGFSDPLAECKKSNTRIRVDKVLNSIDVDADEKLEEKELNEIFDKYRDKIRCEKCGRLISKSRLRINRINKEIWCKRCFRKYGENRFYAPESIVRRIFAPNTAPAGQSEQALP